MLNKLLIALFSLLLAGCGPKVPLEASYVDDRMKAFPAPQSGMAGIYLYRDSAFLGFMVREEAGIGSGAIAREPFDRTDALKKSLFINGECIGSTVPFVYFYEQVAGDTAHVLETEGEYTNKTLRLYTESGKNYFVRQYLTPGASGAMSYLEEVPPKIGKIAVSLTRLGIKGYCGK